MTMVEKHIWNLTYGEFGTNTERNLTLAAAGFTEARENAVLAMKTAQENSVDEIGESDIWTLEDTGNVIWTPEVGTK